MNRYKSPVYDVIPVPVSKIRANAYNPNVVAPPEMKLLELSIWEDGYTSPCVCYYDREHDIYELVDGYHRYMVMKTSDRIYEREEGMLPVVVIDKDLSNRMASTIRHNRARGTHSIELMTNIVAELKQAGMSDAWIMKNIGMDRDELLRLKQVSGLAALFADKEFSIPDNAFGTAPGRGIQNKKVSPNAIPFSFWNSSLFCCAFDRVSRCEPLSSVLLLPCPSIRKAPSGILSARTKIRLERTNVALAAAIGKTRYVSPSISFSANTPDPAIPCGRSTEPVFCADEVYSS